MPVLCLKYDEKCVLLQNPHLRAISYRHKSEPSRSFFASVSLRMSSYLCRLCPVYSMNSLFKWCL